jgi:hypothetical protein
MPEVSNTCSGDQLSRPDNTALRLEARVRSVVDDVVRLTTSVPVRRTDRTGGGVVFICPEYHWGELSGEQRALQLEIKRSYEPVLELLRLLLTRAPNDLIKQLEEADQHFRVWLELQSNWSLSPDNSGNAAKVRAAGGALEKILSVLAVTGDGAMVVVPDTHSLLGHPDPVAYRFVVAAQAFLFTLLPTVLGELDRLKTEHRNPDVREKAKAAITRIKGWRLQGSLSAGVTVDKTITVKACHSEPDMTRTLTWLDGDVQDDRILASVIALQAERPSSRVVLVTGDINLQNKADAALVETAEAP